MLIFPHSLLQSSTEIASHFLLIADQTGKTSIINPKTVRFLLSKQFHIKLSGHE